VVLRAQPSCGRRKHSGARCDLSNMTSTPKVVSTWHVPPIVDVNAVDAVISVQKLDHGIRDYRIDHDTAQMNSRSSGGF